MLKLISRIGRTQYCFSSSKTPTIINVPPKKYSDRQALMQNGWRDVDPTFKKSQQTHLSNAQQLIHKIPVIHSHSNVVRCIGGTQMGAGHPQVYIQLDTREGKPVVCKYCGLRYVWSHEHSHEHHDAKH